MVERRGRETAVEELETAIEIDDEAEKDFHIRQALQLLELDGEGNYERDSGGRDAD